MVVDLVVACVVSTTLGNCASHRRCGGSDSKALKGGGWYVLVAVVRYKLEPLSKHGRFPTTNNGSM